MPTEVLLRCQAVGGGDKALDCGRGRGNIGMGAARRPATQPKCAGSAWGATPEVCLWIRAQLVTRREVINPLVLDTIT